MKTGKSLVELAQEVQRQQEAKRDFLVSMSRVKAYVNNADALELAFALQGEDYFGGGLTGTGHDQLSGWAGIPKQYYEKMQQSAPRLLAQNVQHWIEKSSDRRMIRVLDGNIRGILSDRYRKLDNYDLMQAVLPMLYEAKAEVVSSEVTERKLYIKALVHNLQRDIAQVGDTVEAGIIIQNSEIGYGALAIKPLIHRLSCLNGAVIDNLASRKYHVGRRAETTIDIEYSDETNSAEDKAFWLKTRDLVQHSLSEATFTKVTDKMKVSAGVKLEEPQQAIELVGKKLGLFETEKADVLKHLIEFGSLTNWALGNAITRTAQDSDSYDRSVELESIGYQAMIGKWN